MFAFNKKTQLLLVQKRLKQRRRKMGGWDLPSFSPKMHARYFTLKKCGLTGIFAKENEI